MNIPASKVKKVNNQRQTTQYFPPIQDWFGVLWVAAQKQTTNIIDSLKPNLYNSGQLGPVEGCTYSISTLGLGWKHFIFIKLKKKLAKIAIFNMKNEQKKTPFTSLSALF